MNYELLISYSYLYLVMKKKSISNNNPSYICIHSIFTLALQPLVWPRDQVVDGRHAESVLRNLRSSQFLAVMRTDQLVRFFVVESAYLSLISQLSMSIRIFLDLSQDLSMLCF